MHCLIPTSDNCSDDILPEHNKSMEDYTEYDIISALKRYDNIVTSRTFEVFAEQSIRLPKYIFDVMEINDECDRCVLNLIGCIKNIFDEQFKERKSNIKNRLFEIGRNSGNYLSNSNDFPRYFRKNELNEFVIRMI